jgi:hypothetical protein
MVWLTLSVWLSGSGWTAVNIRGVTPMAFSNAFQNFDINRESQSKTILVGIPCNLYISDTNTSVRFSTVFSFFLTGIKCAIFVKQSIMTPSWLYPSLRGRSVMKSIAIDDRSENTTPEVVVSCKSYALPLYFCGIRDKI